MVTNADALELYMLELVNEERTSRGLNALKLETNLNSSAEAHSQWMLQTNVFSHTGIEASTVTQRIDAEFDLSGSWRTAENIAIQSERGDSGLMDDVADLHTALMNSSGHRANILNSDLEYIGIGIEFGDFFYSSVGSLESVVVTQNFATTQGEIILDPSYYSPTQDDLSGTADDDFIFGLSSNDQIYGFSGNDTLNGGDGSDTIVGGDGDDLLTGGESENDLRDNLFGGSGNDTIDGGYGNDEIRGDAGNDLISGGFGSDTIIGGTGNDSITGSALGDLLFGSDGDDFINGGFGFDRISGGGGADIFYHLGVAAHGSDWISDYDASGGDVLVFGDSDAVREQFQLNVTTTQDAGSSSVEEVFVVFRPTGQIIWAIVDGGTLEEVNLQISGTPEIFDLMG